MEMTVGNGRGYVKSDDNKKLLTDKKVGTIAIDSLYSPIEKVAYEVSWFRLKIKFNHWTGSIFFWKKNEVEKAVFKVYGV